jgi:serine/threonine protein kinase
MEYIPGGDLGSFINERGSLSELEVKFMAEQLIGALGYLHERGITHRDVKPDNILIAHRDPFHVKLTDFGLSKMIDSDETFLRTFCGTLLYCAPEVYSEYREYDDTGKRNLRGVDKRSLPPQRYGHAVDVWSLAGVLFYALCGSPPYPVKNGTSYQELLNQIMTQALDIRPLQHAGVSEGGIRFVRRMLHVRPEHRATIEEMKRSAWVRGYESFELSRSDDEVDMVGGYNNSQIEEGASQLSIRDEGERQINDSQDDMSDVTDIQQPGIPGRFNTSESFMNADESYAFMEDHANPTNGRLFGEVDVSALGSSGAIPLDQLNLPLPNRGRALLSQESEYSQPDSFRSRVDPQLLNTSMNPPSAMPTNMPPPPPPKVSPAAQYPTTQVPTQYIPKQYQQETDDRATRSSSLLGAESMVGHLNMHSPASAASPSADSPMASTEPRETRDPAASLRRPREEEEYEHDDDTEWRPADLPAKRQRRSSREIELQVPPSMFWDPKDKSTHHTNYPRMSTTDFHAYQDYAQSKGEKFLPGEKTFEKTMQSFRSSRSPSLEPDAATRAFSEPTKEEGRRMLMKRDERQLAAVLSNINTNQGGLNRDLSIPETARSMGAPGPPISPDLTPLSSNLPRVGNDFQQPKRIIAKLSSTADSVLSTINLNITDSVTSWGRGVTTIIYPQGSEVRIPKYAFKIIIFKPGFYGKLFGQEPKEWKDADQDMKLYISTKASQGIWVNGIAIPSHDCQEPDSESKFWTELKHGDEITVWHMDKTNTRPEQNNRLRFECFWGKSRESRNGQPVEFVKEGEFLNELEHVCLVYEHKIIKEKQRRAEEEKKIAKQDKENEKKARQADGGVLPASA